MSVALSNQRIGMAAALVVVAMLGMSYAAVPLYRKFCEVTGFAGTPRRALSAPASAAHPAASTLMTVRFDANVNPGLAWDFGPDQPNVHVQLGEPVTITYHARNLGTAAVTGRAAFNVSPAAAAPFFNKLQCFCFTEQRLAAGERKTFPVTLFVDPAIANDPAGRSIHEITLSYTFFRASDQTTANSASTKQRLGG